MERIKPLIFFILITIVPSSFNSVAQTALVNIDKELNEIAALKDKTQAIAQLQLLLKERNLSPLQRFAILSKQGQSYFALSDYNRAIQPMLEASVVAGEAGLMANVDESNNFGQNLNCLFSRSTSKLNPCSEKERT